MSKGEKIIIAILLIMLAIEVMEFVRNRPAPA